MADLTYPLPTLSFGNANVISCWLDCGLPTFSNAEQIIWITGFPINPHTLVVNAWVTQSAGGKPKIGDATFYTTSVQYYYQDNKCRIHFHHDSADNQFAGVMLTIGAGCRSLHAIHEMFALRVPPLAVRHNAHA
jgi:hypothetical protein